MHTQGSGVSRKRGKSRKAGLIKQYLVPGKHNQYRAKLLRAEGAGVTALAVVLLFLGAIGMQNALSTSASPQVAAVVASSLVDLANGDRASQGLPALKENALLEEAAQLKANDMAANDYFAHTSPAGLDPWHWFQEVGYDFSYAGENLAVFFSDSSAVNTAWMNSPEHRANLLDTNYTEIGIATASGMYEGQQTVFVVEEFGTPASASVAEAPASTPAPTPAPEKLQKAAAPKPAAAPASTPSPQPTVAGAQSDADTDAGMTPVQIVEQTPTSIAVRTAAPQVPAVAPTAGSTLSAHSGVSSFFAIAATSPQTDMLIAYELIALVIVVAIVFELALEIEKRRPRHLARGFALLGLMGVLMLAGHFMIAGQILIV